MKDPLDKYYESFTRMLFVSTLHPTVHMYISLWILHILNIKTKQNNYNLSKDVRAFGQSPSHLFALYLTLSLIWMMCTGSHIPGEDSETNTRAHTHGTSEHRKTNPSSCVWGRQSPAQVFGALMPFNDHVSVNTDYMCVPLIWAGQCNSIFTIMSYFPFLQTAGV